MCDVVVLLICLVGGVFCCLLFVVNAGLGCLVCLSFWACFCVSGVVLICVVCCLVRACWLRVFGVVCFVCLG